MSQTRSGFGGPVRDATEYEIEALSTEIVEALSPVLPSGDYQACLFSVRPRYVERGSADDYFKHEFEEMWGQPRAHDSDYYRAGQLTAKGHKLESDDPTTVFEFIVPLQRRNSLAPDRIDHYRNLIRQGHKPTAIALGVLDIRYPIHSFFEHENLLNFILDGHHKVEAAHKEQAEITLLSFIRTWQRNSADELNKLMDAYRTAPHRT